ncbi:MAG TPA: hypothetical protein VJU87_01140, partial [Gemmatimonadaceae bacterium]|nr:hypothetical protein [Gemmatimonadaceae bacterium]
LSITIPSPVVRRWSLRPGLRLAVRSTVHGILLWPVFPPRRENEEYPPPPWPPPWPAPPANGPTPP